MFCILVACKFLEAFQEAEISFFFVNLFLEGIDKQMKSSKCFRWTTVNYLVHFCTFCGIILKDVSIRQLHSIIKINRSSHLLLHKTESSNLWGKKPQTSSIYQNVYLELNLCCSYLSSCMVDTNQFIWILLLLGLFYQGF